MSICRVELCNGKIKVGFYVSTSMSRGRLKLWLNNKYIGKKIEPFFSFEMYFIPPFIIVLCYYIQPNVTIISIVNFPKNFSGI